MQLITTLNLPGAGLVGRASSPAGFTAGFGGTAPTGGFSAGTTGFGLGFGLGADTSCEDTDTGAGLGAGAGLEAGWGLMGSLCLGA